MGLLKPDISSRAQRSPATPLGEDILSLLRKQLTSSDTFGSGITDSSQGAMKAIDRFIGERQTPDQFLELMGPLREMFATNINKSAAQTRESLGVGGQRASRGTARAVGQTVNEGNQQLQALMSQLFLGEQGNLLNAIGQKQQMSLQNILPFLEFGSMGILPDQTLIEDSPTTKLMKGLGFLINAASKSIPGAASA